MPIPKPKIPGWARRGKLNPLNRRRGERRKGKETVQTMTYIKPEKVFSYRKPDGNLRVGFENRKKGNDRREQKK